MKQNPTIIYGGIIGFLFGLFFTKSLMGAIMFIGIGIYVAKMLSGNSQKVRSRPRIDNLDYIGEILALISIVVSSDNIILQSELNYVKRFLSHNFTDEETRKYLIIFREYTKKNLSIDKICSNLDYKLDPSSKRQILHLIIGAAVADRELSEAELKSIYIIANSLSINRITVESLLSMHHYSYQGSQNHNQGRNQYENRTKRSGTSINQAYKILEITPQATESEIKKAYRKLVVIYHPDKVSNMGESFQKSAKEKFQKVQDAYEQIKLARNIK